MSSKRNRAGNQQPYVPAGNGDESGEYRDSNYGTSLSSSRQADFNKKFGISDTKKTEVIEPKELYNKNEEASVDNEKGSIDDEKVTVEKAKSWMAENYKNINLSDLDERTYCDVYKCLRGYEQKYPGMIDKEIHIASLDNLKTRYCDVAYKLMKKYLPDEKYDAVIKSKIEKDFKDNYRDLNNGNLVTIRIKIKQEEKIIGININKNLYNKKKYDLTLKDMQYAFDTKQLTTNSVKGFLDHEIGHYLTDDNIYNKVVELYRNYTPDEIRNGLSRYPVEGTKSPESKYREIIAESWAEYMNSPNPREISKTIANIIIKEYQQKRGR